MAITAALLLGALRLRAGDPASMNQHYLVELSEAATAVDDPDAVATELAQTYGGHPEAPAPGRIRGFAMTMSAPEARLLAADPRVKAVRETTAPSALKQAPPRRIIADDVLPPITVGPFKYDGAGNIIHMGTDRYTYDEMSRITSGTAVTAQNADTQQFGYDGFGNLKTVTVPNKSIVYIDSDPSTNRLRNTSGSETGTNVLHFWGGSYDAAGNQLWSSGTPSYIYDSMNMLAEMTNPRHEFYLYDGDDERVATVSYTDAQNAVWRYTIRDEDSHVLRTVTDTILSGVHSWQQTEDYVYRTGGLLAAITPQGSTEARKHFHLDHLGSAVLITDDSGQRVSSHKFLPFGAEAPGGDTDGERMKFTGHERDVGSLGANGLDYMHARYYDSNVGRFLSVDPGAYHLEEPQSWNRYAYVANNPIAFSDPDGRERPYDPKRNFDYAGGNARVKATGHAITRFLNWAAPKVALAAAIVDGVKMLEMAGPDVALETFEAESEEAAAAETIETDEAAAVPLSPMERGKVSEARVLKDLGMTKNTKTVSTDKGDSIPDAVTSTSVVEIKDTKVVANTTQLQIQRGAALATGRGHTVVTGTNTHVTKPVQTNSTVVRRDDLGPQD